MTARPAGPELAPNQVGEDELMPFPVLDACFYLFAGEKLSPAELLAALVPMFPERGAAALKQDVEKFVRLFTQSIYKWVQSPLSLHMGNLDLDRERALQAAGRDWLRLDAEALTATVAHACSTSEAFTSEARTRHVRRPRTPEKAFVEQGDSMGTSSLSPIGGARSLLKTSDPYAAARVQPEDRRHDSAGGR